VIIYRNLWGTTAVLAFGVMGCGQGAREEEEPAEVLVQKAQTAEATETEPATKTASSDHSSAAEVGIEWTQKSSLWRGDLLRARIVNRSGLRKKLRVGISVQAPNGQAFDEAIEERNVEASAGHMLSVAAAKLPLRSAGLASEVVLWAEYESRGVGPDRVVRTLPIRVFSETVYVVFDHGFQVMEVRNEQAYLDPKIAFPIVAGAVPLVEVRESAKAATARSRATGEIVGYAALRNDISMPAPDLSEVITDQVAP
jgi:hypothetical protein